MPEESRGMSTSIEARSARLLLPGEKSRATRRGGWALVSGSRTRMRSTPPEEPCQSAYTASPRATALPKLASPEVPEISSSFQPASSRLAM